LLQGETSGHLAVEAAIEVFGGVVADTDGAVLDQAVRQQRQIVESQPVDEGFQRRPGGAAAAHQIERAAHPSDPGADRKVPVVDDQDREVAPVGHAGGGIDSKAFRRRLDAGVRLDFPANDAAPTLPLALGGVGISLLDLTRLYAGLAHDGRSAAPHILEARTHEAGTLMTQHAARMITAILRSAPPPDGRMPGGLIRDPRPIAYKTGTSYGFRDAWAVGYSPSWTVGVWTGRADGTPRPGAYGRNTAAPLLFAVFDRLPTETEPDPLARVPDALRTATEAPVPRGLRLFTERDSTRMPGSATPPRIQFPPDGAQLDLTQDSGGRGPLKLEANSGTPPYRWSVNGLPIPTPPYAAAPSWQPDGPGFVRVTVVDAAGRRASASVRVR
jgi:penicillin-binding protein 1C